MNSDYKLFREQSGFSAVEQEGVFLATSRENECDYCMAARAFVAEAILNVKAFIDVGYSEVAMLEIIQTISVKTISNYSNHLFHTTLDGIFKEREWKAA